MRNLKNYSFVLYSDNLEGIRENEKIDGKYIKLDVPIKFKMFGVYKHSFPISLTQAMKSWACWKQILSFQRFYHSVGMDENIEDGTKFNIFLLPIIYVYSLIDTKMIHKVAFLKTT